MASIHNDPFNVTFCSFLLLCSKIRLTIGLVLSKWIFVFVFFHIHFLFSLFSLSTYLIYYYTSATFSVSSTAYKLQNYNPLTSALTNLYFFIHFFTITPSSLFTAVNLFLAALIVLIGIIAMYSRSFYWLLNIGYVSLLDVFSVDKIENRKNKIFSIWILSRFCLKISFVMAQSCMVRCTNLLLFGPTWPLQKNCAHLLILNISATKKNPLFSNHIDALENKFYLVGLLNATAIAIHSHYSI